MIMGEEIYYVHSGDNIGESGIFDETFKPFPQTTFSNFSIIKFRHVKSLRLNLVQTFWQNNIQSYIRI